MSNVLESILDKDNLNKAYTKVVSNKGASGVDGVSVYELKEYLDNNWETIGEGLAVVPSEGVVKAPFDGTITVMFPTKHAVGLVSDNGMEVLIHVGMDTVKLDGLHFESFVEQGQKVKKGDVLLNFDIQAITDKGYSLETPIIITNKDDYLDILPVDDTETDYGEILIRTVIR